MVFQQHIKKVSQFFGKEYNIPNFDNICKKLWFDYLNQWREGGLTLQSKFTFTNPGHYQVNVHSSKHSGMPTRKLPQSVINQLEEAYDDIQATQLTRTSRKKSMNYDFIFSQETTNKAPVAEDKDDEDQDPKDKAFLTPELLEEAKLFHSKSRRRYKTDRKLTKKIFSTSQPQMRRRRKSSLNIPSPGTANVLSPGTGFLLSPGNKFLSMDPDSQKVKICEELEAISRRPKEKAQFWKYLRANFDTLLKALEIEYIMKLYVHNMVIREGNYNALKDWRLEREFKSLSPKKIALYLTSHLFLDDPLSFQESMTTQYLSDYRSVFYTTIFFIDYSKDGSENSQISSNSSNLDSISFPCTIERLQQEIGSLNDGKLKKLVEKALSLMKPAVANIIADRNLQQYSGENPTNEEDQIENTGIEASQSTNPVSTHPFSSSPSLTKPPFPLDDSLIFLLPFISLKQAQIPLTAREYLQTLEEHPREVLINDTLKYYKDMERELTTHLMGYRLMLNPETLGLYQKKLLKFLGRIPDERTGLLFEPTFYLRQAKKVFEDVKLPSQLIPLGLKISSGLLAKFPEFIQEREELSWMGVAYFLFKAFYGIGTNYPSLILIKKSQAVKQVSDIEIRDDLINCLETVAQMVGQSELTALTHSLPTFESIVENWVKSYRNIKRKNDSPAVFTRDHEDHSNMTYTQMISFIESLGGAVLEGIKERRFTIVDRPKVKDRIKRVTNTVKVEVNYTQPVGFFDLKDEISEEMDFIKKAVEPETASPLKQKEETENGAMDISREEESESEKEIQLPHPSDIYVKFKRFSSMPIDKFTEDLLLLLEFFTVYAGIMKEHLIQNLEKTENKILALLGENKSK